jgi:hypothetical protein
VITRPPGQGGATFEQALEACRNPQRLCHILFDDQHRHLVTQ